VLVTNLIPVRFIAFLGGILVFAIGTNFAQSPAPPVVAPTDEQALWNLERAYWRYVEDNDLVSYKQLWHDNFLGWPSVSSAPTRKDHITDWITSQTNNGLVFKTLDFKPAALQLTGNLASVYYWITFQWLDKQDKGTAHTIRIAHTWIKTGSNWRIIAGMSMPEPEGARK
jgi:Domain of unknown function (DUF4440)